MPSARPTRTKLCKTHPRRCAVPPTRAVRVRLRLETLEDRVTPSGSATNLAPTNSAAALQAPTPATPSDMETLAGEGFNNFQVAPDGTVAELIWRDGGPNDFPNSGPYTKPQLIYRTLTPAGAWHEELVATSAFTTQAFFNESFTPYRRDEQAQLVFRSDSSPEVFRLDESAPGQIDHYRRAANGTWQLLEQITAVPWDPSTQPQPVLYHLAAAIGPGDVLSLAVTQILTNETSNSPESGLLLYGTNRGGAWSFQAVTATGDPEPYLGQDYAPRFFSMAVDSQGFAHIAYTPAFDVKQVGPANAQVFSQLAYATNRSGGWVTQAVYQPSDGSGDAGLGASIAIGPGDQVAIASFFDKRVVSGSAQYSQLLYHTLQPNGTWFTQAVAASADGYVAGDGPNFTGFAPQLQFDSQGLPEIAFSDHASQHFNVVDNEFAGQIRRAALTASGWQLTTVYAQTDPLHNEVEYPVMVLSAAGPLFAAEVRQDVRDPSSGRSTNQDYTLIEFGPNPNAAGDPNGGAAGTGGLSVAGGGGAATQFVVTSGRTLFRESAAGWSAVGNFITSVNAVDDASGAPVTYALTQAHDLFRLDSSGWHNLQSHFIDSISAVRDGSGNPVLFAVTQGHDLFLFNGAWQNLNSHFILSISAVREASGTPAVYAVTQANDLLLFDQQRGWQNLNSHFIVGISAVRDAQSGQAAVYAITQGHDLFYFDPTRGWQNLNSRFIQTLSAGTDASGRPELYVITQANDLARFSSQGWAILQPPEPAVQLAGADSGHLYVMGGDNAVFSYSNATGWIDLGVPA